MCSVKKIIGQYLVVCFEIEIVNLLAHILIDCKLVKSIIYLLNIKITLTSILK